jgi:hypothetical protein
VGGVGWEVERQREGGGMRLSCKFKSIRTYEDGKKKLTSSDDDGPAHLVPLAGGCGADGVSSVVPTLRVFACCARKRGEEEGGDGYGRLKREGSNSNACCGPVAQFRTPQIRPPTGTELCFLSKSLQICLSCLIT